MKRRGLSLIEVLLATALLAMAAATCVPLLVSAMRVLHESDSLGADQLTLIADALLESPDEHGLAPETLVANASLEAVLPDHLATSIRQWRPEVGAVRVALLESADGDAQYGWLAFSHTSGSDRPVVVLRWVRLADETEVQP